MKVSSFWRRLVCFLIYLSIIPFVVLVSPQSLQSADFFSTPTVNDDFSLNIEPENSSVDIYSKHKELLSSKISSSNLPVSFSSHLSFSDGDIESFYILTNDLSDYTSINAELISQTTHAYFFVQTNLISAFGRETINNVIASEKDIFENNIFFNETDVFGSVEGSLGTIGDGKTIILFANLPSGIAGYFDPMNEYSQDYLNNNGMSDYKSNEWEMVYLDYLERFETTLAHEFQHIIHYNHDAFESRWFDEGCSELAGLLTGTQPFYWNNITPFAESYYRYHPQDSLTYWNFWSEDGLDVRNDYGGAYLFLVYLYEQLGSSILNFIVNDTFHAVVTISDILSGYGMTFNDFFIDWQTALLIDNQTIEPKYGFSSFDFTVKFLKTISSEYLGTIRAPYYGHYTLRLNYSYDKLETSIVNLDGRRIGFTCIYLQDNQIVDVAQIITTNSSLLFLSDTNFSEIWLAFSLLDVEQPSITGAFGTGSTTKIQIQNVDPFYLTVTSPTIIRNSTHLTINDIHILFHNSSDIIYGSTWDNVTIVIYNDNYFSAHLLDFNPALFYGWGCCLNISHLYPGTYKINLLISSGDYHHSSIIHTFAITFDVSISLPKLRFSNLTETMLVRSNITINPPFFTDYVFENSEVYAYIYNSNHSFVDKIPIDLLEGNTWLLNCTSDFLEEDNYYVYVRLHFEGEDFHSFRSNVDYYTQESIQEDNLRLKLSLSISIPVIVVTLSSSFLVFRRIRR